MINAAAQSTLARSSFTFAMGTLKTDLCDEEAKKQLLIIANAEVEEEKKKQQVFII